MALWLVRAGKHGEYEQLFLESNRIYLTWERLSHDLSKLQDKPALRKLLQEVYPDAPTGKISTNTGQIWIFAKRIQPGDWIALPSKLKPAIHIGEATGEYVFHKNAEDPYFHTREMKWIETDIPRSNFDQDILYSLGAFMSICQVSRNDAEARVRAMANSGWKTVSIAPPDTGEEDEDEGPVNLERVARDQIAKLIIAKFKGHGLARLVEALLKAQGYTTFLSPEGPDKGVDILAAPGPLGFGQPRICVQVKSSDSPADHPTLNQLIGAMQSVQANQGLLVSWGGFKSSIDKDTAQHFFRVRLWDQDAIINELFANYDKLDEDLRAEIPLKRLWALAAQEED